MAQDILTGDPGSAEKSSYSERPTGESEPCNQLPCMPMDSNLVLLFLLPGGGEGRDTIHTSLAPLYPTPGVISQASMVQAWDCPRRLFPSWLVRLVFKLRIATVAKVVILDLVQTRTGMADVPIQQASFSPFILGSRFCPLCPCIEQPLWDIRVVFPPSGSLFFEAKSGQNGMLEPGSSSTVSYQVMAHHGRNAPGS